MSEQNKALVREVYDSFKATRIDRMLGLMSNDITWTLPEIEGVPFGGRKKGLKSVSEFFVLVNTFQETLLLEPRALVAEGDKVVVLGSYSLRVRSTRREYDSEFAHVWTVSDGKLTAFQEYTDTAALARAYA